MPATTLSIPDLAGKAVLVTGASTGIGAALALAYAAQKCKVALHYNSSRDAAEKLGLTIADKGGEVFLVQGDFSVAADVERVSRTVRNISAASTGWSTMPAACSAASPMPSRPRRITMR